MAKLIRIQSSKTITVTSGLQHQNVTNVDAHVPDRLKISPAWPKQSVQILRGVGNYPAEIAEWPTVKALVRDKIFTIAGETDTTNEAATDETATAKTGRKKSLAELSEEH